GMNQDRKRTLSAAGRDSMRLLVEPTPIPTNFVAEMDPEVRDEIVALPTAQARVTALFTKMRYTPIPRNAIQTIARTTGDPLRRTRADAHAGDPLEGTTVLSATYGNRLLEALGRER